MAVFYLIRDITLFILTGNGVSPQGDNNF